MYESIRENKHNNNSYHMYESTKILEIVHMNPSSEMIPHLNMFAISMKDGLHANYMAHML